MEHRVFNVRTDVDACDCTQGCEGVSWELALEEWFLAAPGNQACGMTVRCSTSWAASPPQLHRFALFCRQGTSRHRRWGNLLKKLHNSPLSAWKKNLPKKAMLYLTIVLVSTVKAHFSFFLPVRNTDPCCLCPLSQSASPCFRYVCVCVNVCVCVCVHAWMRVCTCVSSVY